jgi:hypothetical protein
VDSSRRDELARIALREPEASSASESGEPWGNAWGTEGAVSFSYCPRSKYDDEEFWCSSPTLNLPWSTERIDQLDTGAADPTESELQPW